LESLRKKETIFQGFSKDWLVYLIINPSCHMDVIASLGRMPKRGNLGF